MISSIEKSILITKYKKDGLNYEEIKKRINNLVFFSKSKRKKEVKDFNQEFKKLWNYGEY